MTEKISETAAEVLEGNHLFATAAFEGVLEEAGADGVRKGSGCANLSRHDRSRDPRGLLLQLRLADGRVFTMWFDTWDAANYSGDVRLLLTPETT